MNYKAFWNIIYKFQNVHQIFHEILLIDETYYLKYETNIVEYKSLQDSKFFFDFHQDQLLVLKLHYHDLQDDMDLFDNYLLLNY